MARNMLIEFRRDTAANWTAGNPTLAAGEPAFETDTGKLKVGDGVTAWTGLGYIGPGLGAVTSVFTRTGAVVAVSGDYNGIVAAALTGATAATRYVGGTTSGAPASGTFAVGDFIIDQTGSIWVCTAAGTPGTWVAPAAGTGLPSGGATGQFVDYGGSPGTGAWTFPPGHEFDYVQATGTVTVTATADGNNNGTAVIDGNAVTYDGATRVKIEYYAPAAQYNVSGQNILCNLYDGTTDLGRICNTGPAASVAGVVPFYGCRFLTPTAAAHTYHIRGWKTSASGSAVLTGGAGGASAYVPMFYRITKA